MIQCHDKRLELLELEPQVNRMKEYVDSVKKAEREINRREKTLQAYLEGRKLSYDEINRETDPERIF